MTAIDNLIEVRSCLSSSPFGPFFSRDTGLAMSGVNPSTCGCRIVGPARWRRVFRLAETFPDTEIQVNRSNADHGNGNNDDDCQPGRASGKQGEREMKERFHSFVVPQIRKFRQMATRRRPKAPN